MGATNFVTETYKTPLIQVITWFFLASAVVSVICRAYTKWAIIRFSTLDDYFVPISLLFLLGQSLAVTLQTTNGYGRRMDELTGAQISTILKAEYAAMLLYIPSLLFSKLPTLVLLKKIVPVHRYRHILYGVGALTAAWAVTSEIVSIFQCRPAHTWDYLHGQCMDRKAFYAYFEAMNAFTELLIVVAPFYVVSRMHNSVHRKFSVASVFSARILPLAVMIVKIVLQIPTYQSSDILFDTWPVTICTQLIQFLSLTCACILYVRPFLEALTSGFISGDDLRRRGESGPFVLAGKGLDVHVISDSHSPDRSDKTSGSPERGDSETLRDILLPPGRQSSRNDSDSTQVGSSVVLDEPKTETRVQQHESPTRSLLSERDVEAGPQPRSYYDEVTEQARPRPRLPPSALHNGLPRVSEAYSPLVENEDLQAWLLKEGGSRPPSTQL